MSIDIWLTVENCMSKERPVVDRICHEGGNYNQYQSSREEVKSQNCESDRVHPLFWC